MNSDIEDRGEHAALVGEFQHHSTYQSVEDVNDEPPEYPGVINVVPEVKAHCEYIHVFIIESGVEPSPVNGVSVSPSLINIFLQADGIMLRIWIRFLDGSTGTIRSMAFGAWLRRSFWSSFSSYSSSYLPYSCANAWITKFSSGKHSSLDIRLSRLV